MNFKGFIFKSILVNINNFIRNTHFFYNIFTLEQVYWINICYSTSRKKKARKKKMEKQFFIKKKLITSGSSQRIINRNFLLNCESNVT